jgi:hypothetical protein
VTRSALAVCFGLAVMAGVREARGQAVTGHGGVSLAWGDLTEIDSTHSASGPGVGGVFWVERDLWHAEATVNYLWLSPKVGAGYNAGQWDLRVGYEVLPTLAVELGLGGRVISPSNKAQDVTTGRVGVRPELTFAKHTAVWGRAAFLIAPRFNGGGDYGLAVELGLGASIATPDDRFRFRTDYEFQRIDRRLGATALPIQFAVAKFGAEMSFGK